MDILEAMTVRRSVRTFTGQPITALQAERIVAAISDAANPFGQPPDIKLIRFGEERDLRPSTYGMIRGACDYLAMGYGCSEADALAAGFAMEQVVLETTRMGLGTCWIAATFRGSDFERKAAWSREQPLKVVIPVGVAARKSLVERVARMAAGSDRRKPMDRLLFAPGFTGPLCGDSPFYEALAMMRLAPSSTNSQPWRAAAGADGRSVDFFSRDTSKLSTLDCGIGICHFAMAERACGHSGSFMRLAEAPAHPAGLRYITTYIRE